MNDNISELAAVKMEELFNSNTPIVLYISAQYKQLPNIIIDQPWSCVFISSSAAEIAYSFAIEGKRSVKVFTQHEEMTTDLVLSKTILPIVFLNGTEEIEPEKLGFHERQLRQAESKKKLNFAQDILKNSYGYLVILGYSPDQPGEIPIQVFYEAFCMARKDSLLLFDAEKASSNSQLKDYVLDLMEHEQMLCYNINLEDALTMMVDVSNDEDNVYASYPMSEQTESIGVYINKKLVLLPTKTMLDTQGFVQLLSPKEVPEITINDDNREEFLYQFLRLSSTKPIWYGYEHGLYLKRSYQMKLIKTVQRDLKGKESKTEKQSIMLIGQNSSSKSVILGALAYEIYREKEYPVLFIRNPDINLDQNSINYKALDYLLQLLEENGARRILVIWDNSASTNQVADARRLNTVFVNRGRKTVLVTSAYDQPQDFYKNQKEDIYGNISVPSFKLINATINLSEEELSQLKRIIVSDTSVSEEKYDRWVGKNEEKNLLTLLYSLLYRHMHTEISSGFQKEIRWGMDHLIKSLEKAYQNENVYYGAMEAAFIKAGFSLSEENEKTENNTHNTFGDKLVQLCNLVATAYSRKVRLPLSLLLRIIDLKLDNRFSIFQQALFDVPFLSVDLPENDNSGYDYVVSFRTQLEAELYLSNQRISPEAQIDYICSMIVNVSAAGEYDKNSELSVIERLIKSIGPNMEIYIHENRLFAPFYTKIIEAMAKLREKIFEPRLACQEVVWLREVYGGKGNEGIDVEVRIQKLREAQLLARNTLQFLSDMAGRYVNNRAKITRNNLIVESAWVEIRLRRIQMSDRGVAKNCSISFDYAELSHLLYSVIASDPTNTYPYNALLNLFINYYNDSSVTNEHRIERLSEILSVIDDIDTNQREVLDNEEFQGYKQIILQYESSEKYQSYYEELLQKGHASGVHLKVRSMLQQAGILDYRQSMSSEMQRETAKKVIQILRENWSVTSSHSGCQMILLNITWLLYNDQPIFKEERQFTKMNRAQWEDIYDICKNFEQQFLRSGDKPFNGPSMYYLLALSSAQLENYNESFTAFKNIDESMMFMQVRNKVWHFLCEQNGIPKKFKGRIERKNYREENKSGYVMIDDISSNIGIHFYEYNLHLPDIITIRNDFEVGLNFIGFSAFRNLEKSKGGANNE